MKLYYFISKIDDIDETFESDLVEKRTDRVVDTVHYKPFPTCETCDKWKTIDCIISKLLSDTLRNSRHKWATLIYPDHDFFCKDHSDFNPDNGGNK